MDIEGKIIQYLGEQSGTSRAGNPWKKREWVLETFGSYPKKVKFHVFGDRADTFNIEVGQDYKISVDVESREFNGKWYTDIIAFRYDLINGQSGAGQSLGVTNQEQPGPGNYGMVNQDFGVSNQTFIPSEPDNDEDLPF